MKYVRDYRLAVDVGGHCGLWAMQMVKNFDRVISFEPVAEHRECYANNVQGDYELIPMALGEKTGGVQIHTTKGSSGDSWVKGEGNIEMRTLDSFGLQDVDLLKIDCEGYELYVLKGAVETLKCCKPAVIVEQKPGRASKFGLKDTEAVSFLKSLGADLKEVISGDYIMQWS
jgi:FkbM family methyltransferase